jgi:AcrR family transcriptional regulator
MASDTYELVHNLLIGDAAVNNLPAGLYGKPRLEAFVRALAHGCQVLEDEIAARALALGLDTANDADLDLLGSIVGERREGLDDADYRRFIAARLLARKCNGTPDELLAILELIAAPCVAVHYDMFAAGFRLYFGRSTPLADALLGRVMRFMVAIKPAGVTMLLVEYTASPVGFESPANATPAGFGAGALSRQLYP